MAAVDEATRRHNALEMLAARSAQGNITPTQVPDRRVLCDKGQACADGVAKCPNCRGPHTAQADLCRKRRRLGRPPRRPPEGATAGEEVGTEMEGSCIPRHKTGLARWKNEGLRARLSYSFSLSARFLLGERAA